MPKLKVASLFSGAGGLDLGIHLAGHEPLLFCDSDPGARQVLRAAFPGTRVSEDVCTLERLPSATQLLIAGFPCIDVSRAGLRRGLEGQSTGLVRHVFRLLRESREAGTPVPWVLLENVEALLDRHGGDPPVMQYVVRQFRELGYGSVAWRVVNSAGFGLPNRRKRVFILGSLHGDARDVLLTQGVQRCPGSCTKLFDGDRCFHCHVNHRLTLADPDDVSYALDLGNAQSQAGEDVVPTFTTSNDRMLLLLSSGQSGMLRIEDAERLQGFPEGYTAPCWPIQQPGIGSHRNTKVKDNETEVAASKRWDLLGNAVTVPVARWLGERLANPYTYKYHGIGTSDRRMDHLLDEGHEPAPRESPNIWSFVAADQLQQALVFPFNHQPSPGPSAPQHPAEPLPLPPAERGRRGSGSSSSRRGSGQAAAAAAAGDGAGVGWVEGESSAAGSGAGGDDEDRAAAVADTLMAEIAREVPLGGIGEEGEEEGAVALSIMRQMFQGELVHKVKRGSVQTSLPPPGRWEREAWPRSGWWVAGLGCYAVEGMSDVPVPTRFQPLGTFITQVGRPGKPEEMESYLHRLKERGFEVSPTIEKALKTGVRVCKQAQEITRIPDLLSDADMIGGLVWAKDPISGLWWPAEVLDPHSMPKGRLLPDGCDKELEPNQRVASLPWVASKSRHTVDPIYLRVVVAFLPVGGSQWVWEHPGQLLDFEAHCARKEAEMRSALRDGKNSRFAETMRQALQDAKASLAIKKGKNGVDVERMRRTRAAAAAASVNLKQRCGACRTCMNKYANQRRYECLTQRMKAAALSGHAGAQVAIMGEDAVGARVAVWWDGDQTSYEGHIAHFDAVSTEHTVCYDDGEVGMHRLWQHDERIRVLTPVALWPRDALLVRDRLGGAREEMQSRKRQRREVQTATAAATAAAEAPATDYERERQRIIERNRRTFDLLVGGPARAMMHQQQQQEPPQEEEEEEGEGQGQGHGWRAGGEARAEGDAQAGSWAVQPAGAATTPAGGEGGIGTAAPAGKKAPRRHRGGKAAARPTPAAAGAYAAGAPAAAGTAKPLGKAPGSKRKRKHKALHVAPPPSAAPVAGDAAGPQPAATPAATPAAPARSQGLARTPGKASAGAAGAGPIIVDITTYNEEGEEGDEGALVPVLAAPAAAIPTPAAAAAASTAVPASAGGSPMALRSTPRRTAASPALAVQQGPCPDPSSAGAGVAAPACGGGAAGDEPPSRPPSAEGAVAGSTGSLACRGKGPRSPRRPATLLPALPFPAGSGPGPAAGGGQGLRKGFEHGEGSREEGGRSDSPPALPETPQQAPSDDDVAASGGGGALGGFLGQADRCAGQGGAASAAAAATATAAGTGRCAAGQAKSQSSAPLWCRDKLKDIIKGGVVRGPVSERQERELGWEEGMSGEGEAEAEVDAEASDGMPA